MSTIFYKSMCQVFLDQSIIPHFPALYFCTLSQLPLGSLQIFETFRYWGTFQYIVKSLVRKHEECSYCFDHTSTNEEPLDYSTSSISLNESLRTVQNYYLRVIVYIFL